MNDKKLILIVDDQAKNLQLLAAVLYKNNYDVAMADSGLAALDILEKNSPDLILLDIMMPEMDGFETLDKIKTLQNAKDIPVIFLTAKNDNESIVKSFSTGASDYITKPFNSDELLSRVNTHISLYSRTKELKYMNDNLESLVRKRTDELNSANLRLSQLDDAKDYFLSLLSHELKTPVSGIKGFTGIIKKSLNDDNLIEYCDLVIDSTDRLERFTELSLLITRLKTDKYNFCPEPQNIHSIIDEIIFNLSDDIDYKKITVEKNFCKTELMLNIDPMLISKTISIIIDNAVKYNEYNGEIKIVTSAADNKIFVIVKDTGPGFSTNVLENKFKLFSSDELMNHNEGFGLGLAAAKIIMNYHNGDIKIENNDEHGARVVLIFKPKND